MTYLIITLNSDKGEVEFEMSRMKSKTSTEQEELWAFKIRENLAKLIQQKIIENIDKV